MKIFTRNLFALISSLVLIVACSTDDVEQPNPSPSYDGEYFDLMVSQITTSSAHFQVIPSNSFMTFNSLVIDCEYFDMFSSDEEFIADDIAYYTRIAQSKQMTLEEYLGEVLLRGEQRYPLSGLQPDTDYYLYAYGIKASGEVTTPLEKVRFTTASVPQVKADFDITFSNYSPSSVSVHIDVKPAKTSYYFDFLSADDYREWGGDESAVMAYLADLVKYYRSEGYSGEQLFEALATVGPNDDDFLGLKPNTTYYAFAVGVNEQFQPNTKPEVVEFATPDIVPSDMTFEVTITEVKAGSITGKVTPSNNNDKYFWDIQLRETCDYFEDDELMEVLTTRIDPSALPYYVQKGESAIELDHLAPGTDYTICIFGYDGAPTTGLTRYNVSTQPAGNPEDLSLTFKAVDISFDRATIEVDASVDNVPYIWRTVPRAQYESLLNRLSSPTAVVDELLAIEYESFVEAMHSIPAYDGFEWTPSLIANELFELGDAEDTPRLAEATEYVVWGVSIDLTTGLRGADRAFFSEPFTTTKLVAGEASVKITLGNYYDGTELYEKGGAEFADLKGLVVATYTIEPNASAATWYSCVYQSDLSSASDKNIINNLVVNGYDTYTDDTPEEYRYIDKDATSGVSILEYDTVYSVVAIAKDEGDNYGKGVVLPFELKRSGVSPAEEFINALSRQRARAKRMGDVRFE